MNNGDKVKVKGTEHTAKVASVHGKEVVIVWDAGGYGRVPIDRLEVLSA